MIDAGITEEILEQVAESAIVHCNTKSNAETIARILDDDVDGKDYLQIGADGTLVLDLPIDVTKVKRILLTQTGTDIGNMYYVD